MNNFQGNFRGNFQGNFRYAGVFGLLGLVLILGNSQGLAGPLGSSLVSGLGLWWGLSLLIVAAGYAGLGSRVFGKQVTGGRSPLAAGLLAPYLGVVWLLGRAFLAYIDRHGVYHEVAPNLWLGRRLRAWELPEFITLVVDLTCEYTRHRQWTCAYLCVPTLDDAVPDRAQYERAIAQVVNWSGPVYVHCAAGAGRSALLAAGVLLRRGLAATPAAAEAMLRERRAVVHLQPGQRQFLQQFHATATLEGTNGLEKQC